MTKAKGAPKKTVLFGIGAAIILLLLTLVIYQVDSTEYAVVTQFGQPVRVVEDAGLKIKLPDPIQSVQRLDKRVQVYQTSSIELLTLDRLNVSLDYYGTWKIVDPILFLQTVRDNIGAEARLLDVFSSSLSVQLGQYKLEQLVNTDAEKLELDTMIADTVAYVDPALYLSQQDEITHKLKELKKLRRRALEASGEDQQLQNTEAILEYLEDSGRPFQRETVDEELFEFLIQRLTVYSAETVKFRLYNGLELAETMERAVR